MSEPESLQQVREGLRSFRKTTAQRQRQEADADAQLKAEQKQADEALNRTRQEAEALRVRNEAETTRRYQAERQAADVAFSQARQTADARLKQVEADIAARFQAARKQADEALVYAKQKADADLQQTQDEIETRYKAVTKQANDIANPDDDVEDFGKALEDWEALESRLANVGMPMVFSLEDTWWSIDSAPEGTHIVKLPYADILEFELRGVADPMQALTESVALCIKAIRETGNAVTDLQRWRETRERRRETIIFLLGIGLLVIIFVLAVVMINQ